MNRKLIEKVFWHVVALGGIVELLTLWFYGRTMSPETLTYIGSIVLIFVGRHEAAEVKA